MKTEKHVLEIESGIKSAYVILDKDTEFEIHRIKGKVSPMTQLLLSLASAASALKQLEDAGSESYHKTVANLLHLQLKSFGLYETVASLQNGREIARNEFNADI